MSDSAKPATKRLYCNRCGGVTNHLARGSHSKHVDLDESDWETTLVTLWTCAGCERGVMETSTESSFWGDDESPTFRYDPPLSTNHHKKKWFRKIPTRLRGIYNETVLAFNANLNVLTAAGLRALVEGICADKGVVGKTLEKKIDGLETLLPKSIVANLHGFRFMGNDAVHELKTPKRDDLKVALEVSEDLLNVLYELDYKASLLPKQAPQPPPAGTAV
ncbi:MAG: DUF4145 domain-containing protein [Vicinamibacterales bacterium]